MPGQEPPAASQQQAPFMGSLPAKLIFIAFCVCAAIVLAMVAAVNPAKGLAGSVELCAFHSVTGLHCAGCGSTRAVHELLHGQILQAFAYNPLTTAFAPFAVYLTLCWGLRSFGRKSLPLPSLKFPLILAVILTFIVFTVARNLPWEPFKTLAPHELAASKR